MKKLIRSASVGLVLSMFMWAGCAWLGGPRSGQHSSSVVAYLYPKEANPLPPTAIPVLNLPLRVGIAFVPTPSNGYGPNEMSEMQKTALLENIAKEFKAYPFVESIQVVPAAYLRPEGSFTNLDQIRRMLGIDVIALVAYDQVQFTNENLLSLSYWTIVGAYLFHGNKNDTQTLMEAAVYDIPSQHLLFRAPGVSQVKGSSTAIDVPNRLRTDSATSFDVATQQLIANLKTELEAFRERVKKAPGEVQIVNKPGYTGGGALGYGFGVIVALISGVAGLKRRRSI